LFEKACITEVTNRVSRCFVDENKFFPSRFSNTQKTGNFNTFSISHVFHTIPQIPVKSVFLSRGGKNLANSEWDWLFVRENNAI